MSEVWCANPSSLFFQGKPDQKMAFSSLHNRERSSKDVDSMFAANVQGLSNISLMSSNKTQMGGMSSNPAEYSLFNSDGLPPPVPSFGSESKPLSRSSSSDTFWSGGENSSRSRNFHLGFDLSDSPDQNKDIEWTSKNDKDKIAAAIWANLPEASHMVPKASVSKAVGAEIRQQAPVHHGVPVESQQSNMKQVLQGSIQGNVSLLPNMLAQRQQAARIPIQLQQRQQLAALPTTTWTSQGQVVTILPSGAIQSGGQVFRAPQSQAMMQQRLINQTLIPVSQTIRAPEISNIVTANRQPVQTAQQNVQPTVTAPQLHSAIGQINELTFHALNQTAAMIMDRHQLESKLLHYAPEQFRSVYNELALPEPLEPVPGRKETSGVDMLLTAQLRENLRINTLVRRIKVVAQLAPSAVGTQAFEKWTEDVRNFQSFLMKMHERARRMHLSSTIAATLYSSNDASNRVNDSALFASMLNDLMSSTLAARQALFQLGERAIGILSQAAAQKKTSSPSSRDRSSGNAFGSSEKTRPVQAFQHQPIPVNPESAHQLWRQLGQLQSLNTNAGF